MKIALLNSPVVYNYGLYSYQPTTIEEVRNYFKECEEWKSYLGHPSFAYLMSDILGCNIPISREKFIQKDEIAIAVRVRSRNPKREGYIKNMTSENIKKIGYYFVMILRKPHKIEKIRKAVFYMNNGDLFQFPKRENERY